MAIAKKPNSNQMLTSSNQLTTEQQAFISGADDAQRARAAGQKSKPVMLRVNPEDLARIDRAAKQVGLKRAAFILSSAVERAGRMERGE